MDMATAGDMAATADTDAGPMAATTAGMAVGTDTAATTVATAAVTVAITVATAVGMAVATVTAASIAGAEASTSDMATNMRLVPAAQRGRNVLHFALIVHYIFVFASETAPSTVCRARVMAAS